MTSSFPSSLSDPQPSGLWSRGKEGWKNGAFDWDCKQIFKGLCIYICIYIDICIYIYMYVRTYVRTYVCMYVCIRIYNETSIEPGSLH